VAYSVVLFKVTSGNINGSIVCIARIQHYTMHINQYQWQRLDVICVCEQLLFLLSYSLGRLRLTESGLGSGTTVSPNSTFFSYAYTFPFTACLIYTSSINIICVSVSKIISMHSCRRQLVN